MEKFPYMNRSNLEYVEALMEQYKADPDSVDPVWQKFFEGVEFAQGRPTYSEHSGPIDFSENSPELGVYELIQAYRDYGHLKANLDPLGLQKRKTTFLDFKRFRLDEIDTNKQFDMGGIVGLKKQTLSQIIDHLEKWYCGTLAIQVAECNPEVREWFTKEIEKSEFQLSKEQKQNLLKQLTRTETLEKFLHTRYVGTKRFSIEGCDSLIPALEYLCEKGASLGVEGVTIGMAHRGRINVLANFMEKALKYIFAEFDGHMGSSPELGYDADVKYHLGYNSIKKTKNGDVRISLAFNPSHLEAVNPVVLGIVRAQQRFLKDTAERKKVVPVLIHGDAAVIGQGVVSETFQLSQLKGYTVGGTIHIVMNNQVGFTTSPSDARSTEYCSDIAKSIKAPIILVNGDDVEACVRAMDMAVRFRQQFKQDVVIEIVGYRRFGHNEGDEPAFTQPKMYDVIKKHPTTFEIYKNKLNDEGLFDAKDAKSFYDEKMDNLQKVLDEVRAEPPEVKPLPLTEFWEGFKRGTAKDFSAPVKTATSKKTLEKVLKSLVHPPAEFNLHPKVKRLLKAREEMWQNGNMEWGLVELLAYGSLVVEGTSVRLTGQDCIRGTFTHRHSEYFDTQTGAPYSPLKNLNPEKEFCVYNSSLSEYAVLGFEYGNSIQDPTFLTIWEAQFGDFANGAQIIIDQFISSGEAKWHQMNGLVLLLPHGYEGQGPEHSSARLERFLQLCAQYNMQVCNFTLPHQLFHAMRRQVKRDFRKPLVVMSPKYLLRHPKAVSKVEDLTEGRFMEVLDDPRSLKKDKVKRLVLCSGKIYFDLEASDLLSEEVALVRIEQLYPYPDSQVAEVIKSYPNLREIIWAQEEPQNMGAYSFIMPRIRQSLQAIKKADLPVYYVGRIDRASPATGSPSLHKKEQEEIIQGSLDLNS
ncbi:MAG: 2-oxoglutarate dehydrogenase E1 component [Bdellovibrionaceae bacterium]|nr:2-oxoglutarate dehydrogenase E1 component [Pseudobdellovibrionaceae bacterium]